MGREVWNDPTLATMAVKVERGWTDLHEVDYLEPEG